MSLGLDVNVVADSAAGSVREGDAGAYRLLALTVYVYLEIALE